MYITGIADEAAADLEGQIEALRTLGWKYIDLRTVDGVNVTNLSEEAFDTLVRRLDEAGLQVSSLCSEIANWGRSIDEPFDRDVAELKRALPRMKRMGTSMIRIMSYRAPEGRVGDHPREEEEIITRLRELTALAREYGCVCLHENCETWGGQSPDHTLRLLEEIDSPSFQLVFDTGNPFATADRRDGAPERMQNTLDFYRRVRKHVAYVHIKDGRLVDGEVQYTYPGEGEGMVREFLRELQRDGYDGGVSIEPHTAVVFHNPSIKADPQERRDSFIEYGERTKALLREVGYAP